MGLLPELAAEFEVSIPAAGWIVTGSALGIAVGGPIVAIATLGVESRRLLLIPAAAFVAATLACGPAATRRP